MSHNEKLEKALEAFIQAIEDDIIRVRPRDMEAFSNILKQAQEALENS